MTSGLRQDFRHALRLLAARPAFSSFVVLVLALGIGANSALLGVADALLLDRLAFPTIARLVVVQERNLARGFDGSNVSFPNFRDFVDASQVFAHAAVATPTTRNLGGVATPERLEATAVSPGFFAVFGVPLLAGRTFREADQDPGGERVVILAEVLWRERYGGEHDVMGKSVVLDGRPHTVVGVAPRHALYADTDVWLPLPLSEVVLARSNHFLSMYGVLRSGVSVANAAERLDAVARALEVEHPQTNEGWGALLQPLRSAYARDAAPLFLVVGGAVGLVLLLVCANVAGLLIARTAEREREIAVRLALGAGRSRVARQLVVESLVLALVAGLFGALLGLGGAKLAILPLAGQLQTAAPSLDPAVVLATLAVALICGLLCGSVPAISAARRSPGASLARGGMASSGRRSGRARAALVVGQVALALPLLVLALSFLLILHQARSSDLGFEPEGLLALRLDLPAAKYPEIPSRTQLMDRVREEVAAIPGVTAVGYGSNLPFSGSSTHRGILKAGETPPPPEETRYANFVSVSPGYSRAVGLRYVHGRAFSDAEAVAARPVAVINETLARQLFGRNDLVGESVWVHTDEPEPRVVLGVFADARSTDLRRQVRPEILVPSGQLNWTWQWLVVRSQRPPEEIIAAVRARVAAVDPDQPVYGARTMRQLLAHELAVPRLLSVALGAFGLAALGLAMLGLYGLVATAVRQRTREVAIRIALGAAAGRVVREVMRDGARLTALGLVLGLGLTFGAQRLLAAKLRQLAELAELTPLTATLAVVVLAVAGGLACYRPARCAAHSAPAEALRAEG